MGSRRGLATVALLACALSACTSATSLRQRATRTVGAGAIVDASGAAAITGKVAHLMTPAGRVDLTLSAPEARVDAAAVDGAHPLRAASGQRLVGVSWLLQRAAYPNSPNRQLTDPYTIFGAPRPVQLSLVADGSAHRISGVDNLTTSGDRPSNSVWMSVPDGVGRWQFRLGYDGVTQTVDARTGKVDAGRAAPLYAALPLDRRDNCDLGADALGGCRITYAVGYPYVDGVGWAASGRTWLLAQVYVGDDFHGAQQVTVAGAKPRTEIGKSYEPFTPFLVPAGTAPLAVRGHATTDTIDRDSTRVALKATLTRSSS